MLASLLARLLICLVAGQLSVCLPLRFFACLLSYCLLKSLSWLHAVNVMGILGGWVVCTRLEGAELWCKLRQTPNSTLNPKSIISLYNIIPKPLKLRLPLNSFCPGNVIAKLRICASHRKRKPLPCPGYDPSPSNPCPSYKCSSQAAPAQLPQRYVFLLKCYIYFDHRQPFENLIFDPCFLSSRFL